MNNLKKRILWGLGIGFVLFFTVGGHYINKYHNEYVKNQPKMYCYQMFYGPPNPVLIIENLKYKEVYSGYYSGLEKGKKQYIEFPVKTLPTTVPVYVLEYTEESLLAEVVSYYDRGAKFGGSYLRGWVYAKTLHKDPPPSKK